MEKLVINIPNQKSTLVKQILQGLGVTILDSASFPKTDYKQKLTKVSTWTEDDLKDFEEGSKAFNNLKPEEW